jgi:hypothetical protein
VAIDENQAKILEQHLRGKNLVCPLCATKSWDMVAVVTVKAGSPNLLTHPNFGQGALSPLLKIFGDKDAPAKFTTPMSFQGSNVSEPYLPIAIIACANCHYLVQLAWLPIVAESRHAG